MNIFVAKKTKFSENNFRMDGDAARDRRLWGEAIRCYREYLSACPEDAAIWVQLGHALKEQGNLDEAVDAYEQAAAADVKDADARLHLGHLLKRVGRTKQAAAVFREAMQINPSAEFFEELRDLGQEDQALRVIRNATAEQTGPRRYFELKDVFQYLNHTATVTGITRVVLGIVNYVLEDLDDQRAKSYEFVHQFSDGDGMLLLPKTKLRQLVRVATAEAQDHEKLVSLIAEIRRSATLIQPKAGDLYFIPGGFWEFFNTPHWLLGLKQKGVYIGVYFYDLIPITHSRYCQTQLTDAFGTSFAETARFCDFSLAISEFVAREVKSYLSSNGVAVFPTIAVPLAHELHFETQRHTAGPAGDLGSLGLDGRPYVLCVCTIEARKNHIYLFSIWQQLIDEGIDVPDLVFVGRPGWRVEDLMSEIEASRHLDGRLHIMHGLSDADLSALYNGCLFTAFPSFVEGWGLPVGESLTHGKVCVASSTSSIPEVGSDLVVYVDPFNIESGLKTFRRLITEPAYLASLETKVKTKFKPRTWQDMGQDFFAKLDQSFDALAAPGKAEMAYAPALRPGVLLDVGAIQKSSRRRSDYMKNPIRLIFADGWWPPEEGGIWMRGRTAKLRFHADYAIGRDVAILLQVSFSPWLSASNMLTVAGSETMPRRGTAAGDSLHIRECEPDKKFWIRLRGKVEAGKLVTIQFRIDGAYTCPPPNIPVLLRLHSVGFSAADDYDARMSLLEQTVLPG
jgi:glycosyltransferase involved in cell wall biosynthesis